jgi:hypothetical protein
MPLCNEALNGQSFKTVYQNYVMHVYYSVWPVNKLNTETGQMDVFTRLNEQTSRLNKRRIKTLDYYYIKTCVIRFLLVNFKGERIGKLDNNTV